MGLTVEHTVVDNRLAAIQLHGSTGKRIDSTVIEKEPGAAARRDVIGRGIIGR